MQVELQFEFEAPAILEFRLFKTVPIAVSALPPMNSSNLDLFRTLEILTVRSHHFYLSKFRMQSLERSLVDTE